MIEVDEANLILFLKIETGLSGIKLSDEELSDLAIEAVQIYENQILTLEDRTEALQLMQGLIIAKFQYGTS